MRSIRFGPTPDLRGGAVCACVPQREEGVSDWRGVRHKRHAVDMRLEGMSESRVNVRCMHIQIWLLAEPDSEGVTRAPPTQCAGDTPCCGGT